MFFTRNGCFLGDLSTLEAGARAFLGDPIEAVMSARLPPGAFIVIDFVTLPYGLMVVGGYFAIAVAGLLIFRANLLVKELGGNYLIDLDW